jgi:hypothetical protein
MVAAQALVPTVHLRYSLIKLRGVGYILHIQTIQTGQRMGVQQLLSSHQLSTTFYGLISPTKFKELS